MKHKHRIHNMDPIEELEQLVINPLVEAAAQDRPKTNLESEVNYKARLKDQFKQSLLQYQKHLRLGVEALELHKKWPHDDRLEKAMELFQDPIQRKKIVSEGIIMQDILGFKNEELLSFYSEGFELYNRGAYHEASHIFLLLTQLNPTIAVFWSALGAAEEKNHEIQGALYAHLLAAELETETLAPFMQAAKCLLMLHQPEDAKKILHHAIEKSEMVESLKGELDKAKEMLKAIK